MKNLHNKKRILLLIEELKRFYPEIRYEDIDNFEKAKKYINQFDLIIRSNQFKDTLLTLDLIHIRVLRKDITSRLKSMDMNNIFNELLVGKIFYDYGYSIQHNPKINSKHPDWIFSKKNKEVIVEVFTLNKYEDLIKENTQLTLFCAKVQKLEYPFEIYLNLSRLDRSLNSIQKIDKAIKEIKNQLVSHPIENITTLSLNCGLDIAFQYNHQNQRINVNGSSKLLGGGAHSYRLIKAFEDKHNKYKKIINTSKMPFIICCVTESFNRMNTESFNEIIFGNEVRDGILSKKRREEISGFLLLKNNYYRNEIEMEYIDNPNAKFKFILKTE